MNIEEAIKSVRDVYVNAPRRYEQLEKDLKKLDMETQDLLHLMELKDLNLYLGFKAYKDLQRVRQERRKVKDEMDLLEPILELNKYQVKPQEKVLNKTLGEVRKIALSKQDRTYKMRVRDDLQELVK